MAKLEDYWAAIQPAVPKRTGNLRIDDGTEPWIVGSDEVGTGCLAGPVVVAAVAVPRGWADSRVIDSKKLSGARGEARRKVVCSELLIGPDAFPSAVQAITVADIDRLGVYEANIVAHISALQGVLEDIDDERVVVVDGTLPVNRFGIDHPIIALPKADDKVPAVSLASIMAKTTRDAVMRKLAKDYPGYGLDRNVGYGTKEHKAALEELGPCALHRMSFTPCRLAAEQHEDSEPREAWAIFDDE